MLHGVVKSIIGIGLATGLLALPLLSQAPQKKVKDQGEYDIYTAVSKETDPNKQIQLLQTWKEKYPDSDYKEDRAAMVAQDYAKLGKPAEAIKAAQDVLATNPKNLTALVIIVNNAIRVNPPTPASLSAGEQAANTLISNLSSLKPAGVKDADWEAAQKQIEQIAQTTLGWVKMQQKQYDASEAAFRKVLQTNPKNGQVSYWLGSVLYAEKKFAPALFEFARAATLPTSDGGLPDAARQGAEQFLERAYNGYHGSNDGLDNLKKSAATAALPPDDLKIASVTDIAANQQQVEEEFLKAHPDIKLWRELRAALKGDGGADYFDKNVKDALIPPQEGDFKMFKAKLVSMENPKELVVAVDDTDGPTGDATLVFESPVRGKLDPGAEIDFAGAPQSYTKDPYNIKFVVDRKNVTGLPNAPAAPARKRPPVKKKTTK